MFKSQNQKIFQVNLNQLYVYVKRIENSKLLYCIFCEMDCKHMSSHSILQICYLAYNNKYRYNKYSYLVSIHNQIHFKI